MTNIDGKYVFAFMVCCLFLACAKYSTPPGGGPEDKRPPVIIEASSEPNYQTNFIKREIYFEFDEWISLSNPIKEVVISPPTAKPLKFSSKGKKVFIDFAEDEKLKENTTYQINFGNAIKDYSVGNIFENFVFVFSTGPVIDSLSISGKVINQLDGTPAKEVYVMLYDDQEDSVMFKQKPFYFSKTKADGSFQLNNLRDDTFQIFALKDENVSYTYDLPEEQVGYYNRNIITSDSGNQNIVLEVFDEMDPPRYITRNHDIRGLIKLAYSRAPRSLQFEFPGHESLTYFYESVKDSIYIWYKNASLDSSNLILSHAEGRDTIFIKKAKESFKNKAFRPLAIRENKINIYEGDSIKLIFPRPIESVDTTKLVLVDSSGSVQINTFLDNKYQLLISSRMIADHRYQLTILPEGIKDWYGNFNRDTLSYQLMCQSAEALGKISLNVINIDSLSFILEFRRANQLKAIKYLESDSLLVFNRMPAGKYNLKIIEDSNGDGEWTGGRLIGKLAPERIKEITLDELKKAWELTLDVDINEIFNGTEIK